MRNGRMIVRRSVGRPLQYRFGLNRVHHFQFWTPESSTGTLSNCTGHQPYRTKTYTPWQISFHFFLPLTGPAGVVKNQKQLILKVMEANSIWHQCNAYWLQWSLQKIELRFKAVCVIPCRIIKKWSIIRIRNQVHYKGHYVKSSHLIFLSTCNYMSAFSILKQGNIITIPQRCSRITFSLIYTAITEVVSDRQLRNSASKWLDILYIFKSLS